MFVMNELNWPFDEEERRSGMVGSDFVLFPPWWRELVRSCLVAEPSADHVGDDDSGLENRT